MGCLVVSLKLCRELLGKKDIDEEDLRLLRQQLYDLAEVLISIHENEPEDVQ